MKGRTWCVEFLDSAKKDGDVRIKYMVTDPDGLPREINGTWEGYKAGDTPDKKATRFYNALNSPPYNRLVSVIRAGNTVCFQLKDDAPYSDINGMTIGDETGQTFNIYDDPPEEDGASEPVFLETVRLSLAGLPVSQTGVVRLGLGQIAPFAEVPTHRSGKPREISEIIEDLVRLFNKLYEALGFKADIEEDTVVIPEVPCTLGARGGTDDPGLGYWLSMLDPHLPAFSPSFDKSLHVRDALRALSARLDLAGLPDVSFADPALATFVPGNATVFQAAGGGCDMAVAIKSFPGRIRAGTKTIDLKLRYTAQLKGPPPAAVTDAVINILVERIDNQQQKVVDRKLTPVVVGSPAKAKDIAATADCDMGLKPGDGVRITATLVCNECSAVVDGPKLAAIV